MTKLSLSLAFHPNPRSGPVLDGSVRPEGIDLAVSHVAPPELFHRQLVHREFDVSEMSISSLLIITAQGDTSWVALPIFTTRTFFGTAALVHVNSGIKKPSDLNGKRVGVHEYQMTAALWARGFFQHEYNVLPQDIRWTMERSPELSHGGATGFSPPAGIDLEYMPEDKNLGQMLADNELDATLFYFRSFGQGGMNRSVADLVNHPHVNTLFPNPNAESARYFKKTGVFPFNHTVILRRSIYETHPWVARNLLEAFEQAKQISYQRASEQNSSWIQAGLVPANVREGFERDLFPYGVSPNRHVIELAMQYSYEQGLTPRQLSPEELFAPTLLDT